MNIKAIYGLKLDIPEPKSTKNLTEDSIYNIIDERYKHGARGKEYNLITIYTNLIFDQIFDGRSTKDNIDIRYPYVRKEWISAVLRYKTNKKTEITNVGVIYKGDNLNKKS